MTSRPPPRTSSTRSRPSVSTSRNSMSAVQGQGGSMGTPAWPDPQNLLLHRRIQFSSPSLFLGGPGMFRRTKRASCERVTITSLSFTAVCMRRTFDWSLQGTYMPHYRFYPWIPPHSRCPQPTPPRSWGSNHCTHGLMCTSSRKLSGVWLGSHGSVAMYLSRVHVIWIFSAPATEESSSSSEYRLSSRRAECLSLTS